MSYTMTDSNGRKFKCIFTPVKITNFILLDDLAHKMYCDFGHDIKSDEHFTAEIPYDKLNNAGGFSKINY